MLQASTKPKLKVVFAQAQAQAQAQQAAVEAHHLDHTAQQLQVKAQTVSHLRTKSHPSMQQY